MLLPFSFNEKSALLLALFIIGSVLGGLLLWKWINQKISTDKWLAGLILLCIFYITPFMLGYANWYSLTGYREFLFYFPFQQLLFIGPVIYFYAQTLLDPGKKFRAFDTLHFLAGLLYNGAMLFIFLNDRVFESTIFFYADGKDMDFDAWYQWAGWFSMVIYLFASIRSYNTYTRKLFDTLSFAEELRYKWVQEFLFAFLGILLLRALFFILNPEWGEFGSKFWYYLSFGILFNYIGFRGYLHTVQIDAGTRALLESPVTDTLEKQRQPVAAVLPAGIEPKDLPELTTRIASYMQEGTAFQNPQLTLSDVASELRISLKAVSSIVNTHFEMNFNDWVNSYRVASVLEKFEQGLHQKQTILSIALESGFNSKSTFNRAFKKHTGTTPQRYLAHLAKK